LVKEESGVLVVVLHQVTVQEGIFADRLCRIVRHE